MARAGGGEGRGGLLWGTGRWKHVQMLADRSRRMDEHEPGQEEEGK